MKKEKEIYLAGGCFWGVESYFRKIKGIMETEVGYANGREPETDYHRLSQTGHAETVRVRYDPDRVHLAEILDRFYRIIDPHSINRQGNDIGTQYRSGIYYREAEDLSIIRASLEALNARLASPHAIEVALLAHFVRAEEAHQYYLDKNPRGYCHIDVTKAYEPLYSGRKLPKDSVLKDRVSDLVYSVTREKGTEAPFTSALNEEQGEGIYVDVLSGRPLFSSADKYDAGCGWPSFTKPITTDALRYSEDRSHGMIRTEVETDDAGNHLGHVFPDGPQGAGGLRYCINGASLRFIPKDQMEEEGYGDLLPYLLKN